MLTKDLMRVDSSLRAFPFFIDQVVIDGNKELEACGSFTLPYHDRARFKRTLSGIILDPDEELLRCF